MQLYCGRWICEALLALSLWKQGLQELILSSAVSFEAAVVIFVLNTQYSTLLTAIPFT